MRLMPRAAVVARPSVPALIALRPSKAPTSVAPIDTAAWSFCCVDCSDSRAFAASRAAQFLGERRLARGIFLADGVHRLVARRARRILHAHFEVPFGFVRPRGQTGVDGAAAARSRSFCVSHCLNDFSQAG